MKSPYTFSLLIFLLILLPQKQTTASHILSPEARISLLTAGPGEQLYAAFGHSALWVHDPAYNIDEVYNWGTFDFDTPNFYLKFMQGRLLYKLTVVPLHVFLNEYRQTGRFVHEQTLNLTFEEKMRIYNFLQINRQPENIYYLYDFFYDNCATRIRDLVDEQLDIDWGPDPHPHVERSFRDMLKPYVAYKPWIELGIDILLGLPADEKATPWHTMFLPDDMFIAFGHARHYDGRVLVNAWREILPEQIVWESPFGPTPVITFWLLFVAGCLTLLHRKSIMVFSKIYFLLLGTLGIIVFFMWFLSDHIATALNMNLLWTLPTHIYFSVRMNSISAFTKIVMTWYARFVFVVSVLLLVSWPVFPQSFHPAVFPLIALSAVLCGACLIRRK